MPLYSSMISLSPFQNNPAEEYLNNYMLYHYRQLWGSLSYPDYVANTASKNYIELFYSSLTDPWELGTFFKTIRKTLGSKWTNRTLRMQAKNLLSQPLIFCEVEHKMS